VARIRSVKPELRTSEVVAAWPMATRYLYVLLLGYVDDRGRGLDLPKEIAGSCFPHDSNIAPATVDRWLNLMSTPTKEHKPAPVCRYEVAGRRYLHYVNWAEHQRINRPTPSRLPPCPTHEGLTEPLTEPAVSHSRNGSVSDSLPGAGEQRSSGAGEQGSSGGPRSEPPPSDPAAATAAAAILQIIRNNTDATSAEAGQLAEWIDRERRPRNLAGLINALAKGPDLAAMLQEQRDRTGKGDVVTAITEARKGPPCEHGEPGGTFIHPGSGKPLCPLCRVASGRAP
jgi:hypothetical protein